ncbi:MAG TPA: fluoride efflux transporter CrcB [Glaciihabitans sp.]|jgi:CrcB protein|nr:fluoride efflux transporter CrcB [Glaciihabitans sp.]
MTPLLALAVAAAGGVGAVSRYLLTLFFAGRSSLPWAVLTVNVIGSTVGGIIVGLAAGGAISADIRLIVLGGFAGGLTTFSTFSVETIQLIQEEKWRTALLSVLANLLLGIAVAAIGFFAVSAALG